MAISNHNHNQEEALRIRYGVAAAEGAKGMGDPKQHGSMSCYMSVVSDFP